MIEPIKWKDNKIVFIDQTELPARLKYVKCADIDALCEAIKKLKIRGAPLIGVAVGLGYALAGINSKEKTFAGLKKDLDDLNGRMGALAKENTDLKSQIEYFSIPENLEKELKSRFNYKEAGEKMMIVVP